jgi:hypothetical protein
MACASRHAGRRSARRPSEANSHVGSDPTQGRVQQIARCATRCGSCPAGSPRRCFHGAVAERRLYATSLKDLDAAGPAGPAQRQACSGHAPGRPASWPQASLGPVGRLGVFTPRGTPGSTSREGRAHGASVLPDLSISAPRLPDCPTARLPDCPTATCSPTAASASTLRRQPRARKPHRPADLKTDQAPARFPRGNRVHTRGRCSAPAVAASGICGARSRPQPYRDRRLRALHAVITSLAGAATGSFPVPST